MTLEEIVKELNLNDEQKGTLEKFQQSTEDRIRTTYSEKIKGLEDELSKVKPKELTDDQKKIQELEAELNQTKFTNKLKTLGVSDELASYLRTDIDVDKFSKFYDGLKAKTASNNNNGQENFVPTKNQNNGAGITKEQFHKMSYDEKVKLYTENSELYSQLSQAD